MARSSAHFPDPPSRSVPLFAIFATAFSKTLSGGLAASNFSLDHFRAIGEDENDEKDGGPDDHFSIILILVPVSPWARRSA